MSNETDYNVDVNVTEEVVAEVDATAMPAVVIDDGDSIVIPAEVDMGATLDTDLEDEELIDVPIDEAVGIGGDHRLMLHRDAPNQHPMSSISGLDDALDEINDGLSSRITQVELESIDLESDMVTAMLRIGELQDQIDGNITTWFYAAEPSMNLPPVALDPSNPQDTGWDTAEKKNAHKGDLYYNTLTGYAYRFAYENGDYGWMRITDTDVVKALADAAKAQDTADSKRRVFYTTPYPPYDKGDLWVQGISGDILVCTTDKPADGAYAALDWSRASKYTDDTVADQALASANGKNTVYHQASQPTGGTYKKGDTWFDTDDDFTMYTYDGALWIKEQFGNEAIADMSITNAKIANATIEYGKIKSVDAGKITVGDLAADRIKASVITAVNGSTETSGGSSLKISADKVNIEGAAIFTSGRLSQDSLDGAYDAIGAADGALSDAKDYADGAVSGKADKSDAVYEEQIIYKSAVSGTTSMSGTTTWVTDTSGDQNKWTTKRPQYSTSYPVLFVAKQRKTVSGTVTCTTPVKDETTTVIDGGHITTGTIDAARLNVSDIIASGSIAVTSDIPTDLSDLTDTQGVIPDVSDKADKTDAVARTQRIYYRKTSSGAPSKNTTWLSTSGTGYGNWSLKVPQLTSGTTKYPYLYTAVQTQTVSQLSGTTCSCSDVLLDDTTTIIDGGTIITGTVNANAVDATSGTFNTANIPELTADHIKTNVITAINDNTGTVKINADKVNIQGVITAINNDSTTTINGNKITTGTLQASDIYIGSDVLTNVINDMTDELGNIYQLNILTSYTSTGVVHTAQLLQNGVDISAQTPNDFEWNAKLTTGYEFIGNGVSITIAQSSLHYAHAVTVSWTRRQYAYLLNNSGNNLVTSTGNKLIGRTEY